MKHFAKAPQAPCLLAPESAPWPDRTTRQLLLSVWCPRVGEFTARVVQADGSVLDFDSPFELARFLATPSWPAKPHATPHTTPHATPSAALPARTPGLR
jgi:hypothetical protein